MPDMLTKYVVFGQQHTHPDTDQKLRKYMIKVQAPSASLIQTYVTHKFGPYYSRILDHRDDVHFPGGILETHVITGLVFDGETSHELVSLKHKATVTSKPEPEPTKEGGEDANERRTRKGTKRVPGEEREPRGYKPKTPGEAGSQSESESGGADTSRGADSEGEDSATI